jgi:RNA polymerase sigma-B factor
MSISVAGSRTAEGSLETADRSLDPEHIEQAAATIVRGGSRLSAGAARALTAEDLPPLFERWHGCRDGAAREALIEHFLPLARSLARRYRRSSESIEDLIQVASLGLVKAIDRYDPSRGVPFAGYAVPTILGELRRHFRDASWAVHVPRGVQERALEVEDARELLSLRGGRPPTVLELAEYLELDVEQVLGAMQAAQAHSAVSLDAPRPGAEEDGDSTRGETIGSEDRGYELAEDSAVVADALKSLSERDRRILHLRFARDMTQSEIATEVGLSQMQISRVIRRSLDQLHQLALGS